MVVERLVTSHPCQQLDVLFERTANKSCFRCRNPAIVVAMFALWGQFALLAQVLEKQQRVLRVVVEVGKRIRGALLILVLLI